MKRRSRRDALGHAFGIVGVLGYGLFENAGLRAQAALGRIVEIDVRRFKFTPSQITLRRGEVVTLAFKSQDFIHGFNAPDLGIRADLIPGQVTRVTIAPASAGRYDFLCDNFCGDKHEEMHGVLIVEA